MNLTDHMGTLGSSFKSVWFANKDHNLVSNSVVVIASLAILSQVVLISERLALSSETLQMDNDWDGQEHVALEDCTPWGETKGFVNADSNDVLR